MSNRRVFLAAFTASLFAGLTSTHPALAGVTLTPAQRQQIDALFADFDTATSPGCSLGVMSDGRMLYARGYGMANIGSGLANDSTKLFEIASDSKQFTAGAIVRLAQQGKLKLTDDIRKYIPELPNYGSTVTINNLLSHTGGLRDYGFLLEMAGYDDHSDIATEAQTLELLLEQRKPDFAPGSRYEYSNTGYFLLALIVKRVSGTSLNAYTRQQFFNPLGMPLSVWRDKHDKVIPNRALGYDNDPDHPDQYVVSMSNWELVGDGGLQTSVEEIQKWDENFYTGQVGGTGFISEMYRKGTLSDGTALHYARGLTIDTYRGLKRIAHGGDWVGYTSITQRFPDQHTSVMLMCNLEHNDQYTLAYEVDDIVLAGHFTKPKPTDPQPAPSLPLNQFVGHYFSGSAQEVVRTYIDPDSKELMLWSYGDAEPLTSIGPSTFLVAGSPDSRVTFTVQGSNPATKITVNRDTLELDARPIQSSRFSPVTASNLSQYTGTFKAPEFDGIKWTLAVSNGQLKLRKGEQVPEGMEGPLQPANAADTFYGSAGYLRFTRNATGRIDGFYLSLYDSTDYRFSKQ
jgi:CubicO group peptidase (beta-lactamase class C family)